MSLKKFHVVLIAAAIVLGIILGVWALHAYSASHISGALATAAGGFAGALLLSLYLAWFILKKMKQIKD